MLCSFSRERVSIIIDKIEYSASEMHEMHVIAELCALCIVVFLDVNVQLLI